MLSVIFNDIELNKYIGVLDDFSPFAGSEFEHDTTDMGAVRGTIHHYSTIRQKKIPMPFDIVGDVKRKYDELMAVISVDKPKKLIFGNSSDRYYMAVPDGDLKIKSVSKDILKGEITWLVPDGVARAIEKKQFLTRYDAGEHRIYSEIYNCGSLPAPLFVEFTHTSDNGYIGVATAHGVAEFGDVTEEDGEKYTESVTLLKKSKSALMNDGSTGPDTFSAMARNLRLYLDSNYPAPKFVKSSLVKSVWNGDGRKFTLSEACPNAMVGVKLDFISQLTTDRGWVEFSLTDADHGNLTGVKIKKTSNGKTALVYFRACGKNLDHIEVPVNKSNCELENITIKMRLSGKNAKFYVGSKTYTYSYDDLKNVSFSYFSYAAGVYSSDASSMPVIRIKSAYVKKISSAWRDLPNRFDEGTEILIDSEKGAFYVDGVESAEDEVIGSEYPQIPPNSVVPVSVILSDFAEAPANIKISIREVYA